ncbi:MAG TPA: GNAT family N-acetyltransferase [Vicinamibacterales bacterium]|jgi:RimJ/RimL family protein N-acetyltransferase
MPDIHAPERLETGRLTLRRPTVRDARTIFATYASDAEVTRYVGWPRHAHASDTRTFVEFSDAEWRKWGAGPYVILHHDTEALIGSTGLGFETPTRAATGYVFARDAWGHGYATEALRAMVDVARNCGVYRLYALCHHEHRASARVLQKGGFALEGTLRRYALFPNLQPPEVCDVLCYSVIFENPSGTEGEMRS